MRKKTICLLIITTLVLSIFPLIPRAKALTGSTATISLLPSTTTVSQVGETFTLDINISGVSDLWLWTANVTWDPTVLNMVGSPQEGGFLKQGGEPVFVSVPAQPTSWSDITDALISSNGVSGSGELAILTFQVIGQSPSTSIQLSDLTLEQPIPSTATTGTAHPTITLSSTSSLTATVSFVKGGAPAANAGSDQTVTEGATVTFDGSKSLPSGSITKYSWSFMYNGVNQTLSGVNPTFTFNIPGIYVVTLIVTNSNGASAPAKVTITVNNTSKPVAVINIEGVSKGQSVSAGQPVTLNGTGSYEANNGTIAKYLWEVGGTSIGTNATITYEFEIQSIEKSATDNVTLTVFDATNQNNTASAQITIVPGSSQTSSPSPTPTTSTPTSTPSPNSSSTTSPTSTPTPNNNQAGLPPYVLAITIIVTIMALGGSAIWLRKRT